MKKFYLNKFFKNKNIAKEILNKIVSGEEKFSVNNVSVEFDKKHGILTFIIRGKKFIHEGISYIRAEVQPASENSSPIDGILQFKDDGWKYKEVKRWMF